MSTHPNILLILVDQHRYDCCGFVGKFPIHTPNLDRLAAEGAAFHQAHTTLPACCPARQAMLTGVKEEKLGAYWNYDLRYATRWIDPETPTWPRALQQAGYQTAFIGKWHASKSHKPTDYGYDSYDGDVPVFKAQFARQMPAYRSGYMGEPDPLPLEQTRTHLEAQAAVETIQQLHAGGRPWHLQVAFHEPHLPCRPAEPFAAMYQPQDIPQWGNFNDDLNGKPYIQRQQLRNWGLEHYTWEDWSNTAALYYGIISQIDDAVGRMLAALEQLGILDDTLVIYTSDHGDLCGAHRMLDKHYVLYDDVTRVPLILRYSRAIAPGSRIEAFCNHTLDLPPTLMDLAGLPPLPQFMGRSLLPLLQGVTPADWPDSVSASFNGAQFGLYSQRMLRTAEWKLVWNLTAEDELYHLSEDPEELINRAEDPACAAVMTDLKAKLKARLDAWEDPLAGHVYFRDPTLGAPAEQVIPRPA
ncbi:MAG: sulfatase-like hydrolase/transferase [Anaerolineae bacterium]|nr:sulfatase-like hydrolase/transferase [Anaerolineae bacterium]